jgi:Fur family transcriptional regulator, peroxide stress response regulator
VLLGRAKCVVHSVCPGIARPALTARNRWYIVAIEKNVQTTKKHIREKLETCERLFRERGLPMTVQRRVIYGELLARNDHPTADEIFAAVKGRLPGVSRTTAYRVLEALVAAGVAQRICHLGSSARYDANMERHHHLVCLRCEKTMDLHSETLDKLPVPGRFAAGFKMLDFTIHFRGICADCLDETPVE